MREHQEGTCPIITIWSDNCDPRLSREAEVNFGEHGFISSKNDVLKSIAKVEISVFSHFSSHIKGSPENVVSISTDEVAHSLIH